YAVHEVRAGHQCRDRQDARPHRPRQAARGCRRGDRVMWEVQMKLPRRKFLHLASGAAALPAVSRIAWAQAYPTRPVTLVVFVPAGGTPDIIARLIGQSLSQRLGQSVVIDNRPGAGGNLALQAVARAPADGYTLLMVATPHAINVTLYEKSPIGVTHDIVP